MAASAVGCRVRGYGLGGRWSGGGGGAGGGSLPCPCECVGVRRPEATGLGVPLEVGDVDRRRLDRHEVEGRRPPATRALAERSEEHTSELQSLAYLVCRLLLEKKKKRIVDIKNVQQ